MGQLLAIDLTKDDISNRNALRRNMLLPVTANSGTLVVSVPSLIAVGSDDIVTMNEGDDCIQTFKYKIKQQTQLLLKGQETNISKPIDAPVFNFYGELFERCAVAEERGQHSTFTLVCHRHRRALVMGVACAQLTKND